MSEKDQDKKSKHLNLMLDIADRYVDNAIQNKLTPLKRESSMKNATSISFEIPPSYDTTDFKSRKREKQHSRI
jgi:hypothetical protein